MLELNMWTKQHMIPNLTSFTVVELAVRIEYNAPAVIHYGGEAARTTLISAIYARRITPSRSVR